MSPRVTILELHFIAPHFPRPALPPPAFLCGWVWPRKRLFLVRTPLFYVIILSPGLVSSQHQVPSSGGHRDGLLIDRAEAQHNKRALDTLTAITAEALLSDWRHSKGLKEQIKDCLICQRLVWTIARPSCTEEGLSHVQYWKCDNSNVQLSNIPHTQRVNVNERKRECERERGTLRHSSTLRDSSKTANIHKSCAGVLLNRKLQVNKSDCNEK